MATKPGGEKKRKRDREKLKKEREERKRKEIQKWLKLNPNTLQVESKAETARRKQRLAKEKPTILLQKRTRKKPEWEVDIPLDAPLSKITTDPRNKKNKKSLYSMMGLNLYKGKN